MNKVNLNSTALNSSALNTIVDAAMINKKKQEPSEVKQFTLDDSLLDSGDWLGV